VKCSRCFHGVGEHLLCRAHGGPDGWTAGAYKLKPRPEPSMPVEAIGNLQHPWWDFLDAQHVPPSRLRSYSVKANALKELVP
jgi:hypothetical protein